ncbi:hypothetical protein OG21DRAFT_1512777, partial [Imleria badia]
MDTLVAVQKLFRLRALIQDSPLSFGDVFAKPTKESHQVAQLPVLELAPQDIRFSPDWVSPVKSVHSTSEEPLPQATIPIPKAFLRTLSRYSSSQSQRLKSSSDSDRQTEKDDMSTCRRERRETPSLANYTGPKTIRSEHVSFLPRAKPPPPLKRPKHARNRSETDISPRDPTAASGRRSTSHWRSSGTPSGSPSTAPRSPRRGFSVPTLGASSKDSNQSAADIQRTLRRTSTRTSIASEASDDTENTIVPSNHMWEPPTSWAGPSKVDVDDRPKPFGWFIRKKCADSQMGGSMRVPTHLNRTRSLRKLRPVDLADAKMLEAKGDSVTRGGSFRSNVALKIQCFEGDGDGWHEKPMADIIPKLRELKL